MLSPRRDTTTADLLRLLACWLVLVLALQGLQAARLRTQGPLHRHDTAHAHHADAQRHWHAPADAALPADGADWDAAAFALTAALALLAFGHGLRGRAADRPPWQAARAWALACCTAPPPERPPRTA